MSSVEAVARASWTAPVPDTSRRSPSRPENSVEPVSETTMRRRTSARGSAFSGTPPSVTSSSDDLGAHAEPVGQRRGLVGAGR
jgi:hypothetical protein